MIPVEQKQRAVLAVLAREATIVEVARRERVSEQSVGRWKAAFLEAGAAALADSGRPAGRERQLEAELAELRRMLREAEVEIEVWKRSAGGRLGPSATSR